ncbi:MAG: HEAT repeat domain-containing protein [Acidobacteriota bacterium]
MASQEPVFSLEEFAKELALGWRKLVFYPAGHPERQGALEPALGQLRGLLAPAGEIRLGVARDTLMAGPDVIGGVGVEKLADALYVRNVAFLIFKEGVALSDLLTLLQLLSDDPPEDGQRIDFGQELQRRGLTTIGAEAVDYSELLTVEDLAGSDRAYSLWNRILSGELGEEVGDGTMEAVMLLVRRLLPSGLEESGAAGTVALPEEARKLTARLAESIGQHLRQASDQAASRLLVRQVLELLDALPSVVRIPVLEAALSRLASPEGDEMALETLFEATAAPDLIAAIRSMRESGSGFSAHLMGLIEGLVVAAPALNRPSGPAGGESEATALVDLLRQDLDQAGAGDEQDEGEFAVRLPVVDPRLEVPADFDASLDTLQPGALRQSLLRTILVLLQDPFLDDEGADQLFTRLEEVFGSLVSSGRIAAATALVQQVRSLTDPDGGQGAGVSQAAARCLHRLAGPRTVEWLLDALRSTGPEAADPLVEALGLGLLEQLIEALNETKDRADRRLLLAVLQRFSAYVAPLAAQRLQDPRWFVVRNMLTLLAQVDDPGALAWIHHCADHEDSRVRLEAIKSLLRRDPDLPSARIASALNDPDERIRMRMAHGVGAFQRGQAVGPLLALLASRGPLARDRPLRVQALTSLGHIGDPAALPQLARFFGGLGLVPLEERRAAYASLAGYPPAARQMWVQKGLKVRDHEIRRVCQRLAREGGP